MLSECDECGQEMEKPVKLEIDPPIKIQGFDYPHEFKVCQECAEEFVEQEKSEGTRIEEIRDDEQ